MEYFIDMNMKLIDDEISIEMQITDEHYNDEHHLNIKWNDLFDILSKYHNTEIIMKI